MPVALNITKVAKVPSAAVRSAYWRGAPFQNLIKLISRDMGDQARVNIIKHGEPGGDWPQLSGFRKPSAGHREAKSDARALRRRMGGAGTEAQHGIHAELTRRAGVLAHSGYARRKAEGLTPGHGRFGPDVRLRDTGELFASLDGVARYDGENVRIVLMARGRRNSNLLLWHSTGAGHNPARNPGQDMALFETRVRERIRQYLINAPRLPEE